MASMQFNNWLATLSETDAVKFIDSCRRQDAIWKTALDSGQVLETVEWNDPEDQTGIPRKRTFSFPDTETPHQDDPEWTEFNNQYKQWCEDNNLEIRW